MAGAALLSRYNTGMGTIIQDVTETPAPLAGIVEGRQYTVQNITANPVRLIVSDTAPDADAEGFILGQREFGYPKAGPGESVFVWRDGRADSRVIYTESS